MADEQRKVSIDDIVPTVASSPTKRTREGFKANVFCTDLGLTKLPISLPPDTVYLNLQNNQVRSLKIIFREAI